MDKRTNVGLPEEIHLTENSGATDVTALSQGRLTGCATQALRMPEVTLHAQDELVVDWLSTPSAWRWTWKTIICLM